MWFFSIRLYQSERVKIVERLDLSFKCMYLTSGLRKGFQVLLKSFRVLDWTFLFSFLGDIPPLKHN